ncbi:MAG: hypothetical protein JWM10_3403 [Myxococcaceae bacterium]|nr:hypothetical protein [Myxococcaceae bacterium]
MARALRHWASAMHPNRPRRIAPFIAATLAVAALAGCGDDPLPPRSDGGGDAATDAVVMPDFADHTVDRLATVADFERIAVEAYGLSTAKFLVTAFGDPTNRGGRFYDSHFYALHDEWYWFRLLNGASVPGDFVEPVRGLHFDSVAAITAWAQTQPVLPLDLAFYGSRLYSNRFYDYSFGAARRYGLATLIRVPPRGGNPERWAFELEYSDQLWHPELVVFFEALRARLPPAIAAELRFLVRSPEQETLAARMEADRLPYWDRILRYRDIVVPGAREVYSDGIAAGPLRIVRQGQSYGSIAPTDIVIMEATPDYLPNLAGLITAAPQTPLAHINLLARNRGIPNVHIAGVLDDAMLHQLERGYAPVLLFAEAPGRAVVAPITDAQYRRYLSLVERPVRVVSTPPIDAMPYVIPLEGRALEDTAALASTIGGKNAGMIALLHEPALVRPDAPQAITVRAYVEHLAPLRERIAAALAAEGFVNDARVRRVVLEGDAAYRARTPQPAEIAWLDAFLRDHPNTDALGSLARGGGVRGAVEATPIAPATLAEIDRALRSAFAALAPTQGIRFRSSSNVEDIEGFNGAGLYESFTGFIDAAAQPRASDRDKTVERAIVRVWGSFWSFEAFEERRAERIDHLSAAMAVLSHPRFDDELERATGVCTFTAQPPNSADAESLEVNVQVGDGSVANPDPTILPEVVRVLRARGGDALRVVRVRRASGAPDRDLLSDEVLRRLFADTGAVTRRWLERENAPRPPARRARTITIDFEFHDMLAGWPAVREGAARPARLVLKQARTLEPAPRMTTEESQSWPVPRDVLARARRVVTETCTGEVAPGVTLTTAALRVLTAPSVTPDVGYGTDPLDASLTVTAHGVVGALDWPADATWAADHLGLTTTHDGAARVFVPAVASPARAGYDQLRLAADGTVTVQRGARSLTARLTCVDEVRFASPRDYLLGLVPP